MPYDDAQLEETLSDPEIRAAARFGLDYLEENPERLLEDHDPCEVFQRACLQPAVDYFGAAAHPKREAMLYFMAYPALENMPRGDVCKKFGGAVADLNEEIKAYTMELEGKIPVDHNRVLSPTAQTILNVFARTVDSTLGGANDDFRAMAYASQLKTHKPKGLAN